MDVEAVRAFEDLVLLAEKITHKVIGMRVSRLVYGAVPRDKQEELSQLMENFKDRARRRRLEEVSPMAEDELYRKVIRPLVRRSHHRLR
jgi:hypothetical protein